MQKILFIYLEPILGCIQQGMFWADKQSGMI